MIYVLVALEKNINNAVGNKSVVKVYCAFLIKLFYKNIVIHTNIRYNGYILIKKQKMTDILLYFKGKIDNR